MDQSVRYKEVIFNRTTLINILGKIANKIGTKLEKFEGDRILSYLKENSSKNWSLLKNDQIIDNLVENYVLKYHTSAGRNTISRQNDIVDIHEIQKLNIGLNGQDPDPSKIDNVNEDGFPITTGFSSNSGPMVSDNAESGGTLGSLDGIKSVDSVGSIDKITNIEKLFGYSAISSIQSIFNPDAGNKTDYLMMDTRYRLPDPDGTFKFSWNVLAGTNTSGQGIVNLLNQVKNIVAIKVFPFRIPYVAALDSTQQYKRITMLIEEFSGMSIIAQEGRKFHFIFDMEKDGDMVDLKPLHDAKTCIFKFNKPITQLDSLTISFANPLSLLKFDNDRDQGIIYYENPLRIVTTLPHNLSTGDLIYISGFTTNDPNTDSAIIKSINNTSGLNVIIANNDGFTLNIDGIDLTTVTAPIPNLYVSLYYGSKRIYIPMEIIYRDFSTTN
jgi:hypothetical protein